MLLGFWFDQGSFADMPRLHDVVRQYNDKAVITFNHGQQLPLTKNNGPYENYTFGYPHKFLVKYPASDCANYAAILSIESSSVDGYFYKDGMGSLGQVLMPSSSDWASGIIVWSIDQAQEWQS